MKMVASGLHRSLRFIYESRAPRKNTVLQTLSMGRSLTCAKTAARKLLRLEGLGLPVGPRTTVSGSAAPENSGGSPRLGCWGWGSGCADSLGRADGSDVTGFASDLDFESRSSGLVLTGGSGLVVTGRVARRNGSTSGCEALLCSFSCTRGAGAKGFHVSWAVGASGSGRCFGRLALSDCAGSAGVLAG